MLRIFPVLVILCRIFLDVPCLSLLGCWINVKSASLFVERIQGLLPKAKFTSSGNVSGFTAGFGSGFGPCLGMLRIAASVTA